MMTCNCNPYLHKVTALSTTGLMTVTNSTNIANLDAFGLLLCVNPNTIITGAPVNYTLTINGATVNLLNRFGQPISSDRLATRCPHWGRYIVPTTGTPYVILLDTPCNAAYAMSGVPAAAAAAAAETPSEPEAA